MKNLKLTKAQRVANKKLADEYKAEIAKCPIDFTSEVEAIDYLESRGYKYLEAMNFKYEKHVVYRRKFKRALLKTTFKYLSTYSMDKGRVYEVTIF